MIRTARPIALAATLAISSVGFAAAERQPLKIALFGDSATRAVLADTRLGQTSNGQDIGNFVFITLNGFSNPVSPEGEGVLNFNLMTANTPLARDHLAYTQGRTPYSLKSRFESEGYDVDLLNVAQLGGSFRIGDAQLALYDAEVARRGGFVPDLVIIDLGRIDFSMFTDPAVFRRQVAWFLEQLTARTQGAGLLFTRIVDIPRYLDRPDRVSLHIPNIRDFTCSGVFGGRDGGGFAAKVGLVPGRDNSARRPVVEKRYQEFNQVLEDAVSQLTRAGHRASLVAPLPEPTSDLEIDAIQAIDCIHVNESGQQQMADRLFPAAKALIGEGQSSATAAFTAISPVAPIAEALPNNAAGLGLWQEYVDSLKDADLQPDCQPRMVPSRTSANRGIVVLFHGFTACPQQYFELADQLASRGFTVLLPLLPGHGRAPTVASTSKVDQIADLPTGRLGDLGSYRKSYAALVTRMNAVADGFGGERIIGGLSLGAAMASYAAAVRPDLWQRQLLLSPLFEVGDPSVRLLLGTLANNDATGDPLGAILDPVFGRMSGWGPSCEEERDPAFVAKYGRTVPRAGICQFRITHGLGANQFGYEVWSLLRPTTVQTQVVAVEEDPVINPQLVFNGVGRMRVEALSFLPFTTAKRFDDHPRIRVCYLPSSLATCAVNLNLPPEEQSPGCINHSVLSRYDLPQQRKDWIAPLEAKLVDFIVDGTFLSTDDQRRAHGDPTCAGFPLPD